MTDYFHATSLKQVNEQTGEVTFVTAKVPFTQEEIDAKIADDAAHEASMPPVNEREIIGELNALDSAMPRFQEDLIDNAAIPVFGQAKSIYDRKKFLRNELVKIRTQEESPQ